MQCTKSTSLPKYRTKTWYAQHGAVAKIKRATSFLNKRSSTQFYHDWKPMQSIIDILHRISRRTIQIQGDSQDFQTPWSCKEHLHFPGQQHSFPRDFPDFSTPMSYSHLQDFSRTISTLNSRISRICSNPDTNWAESLYTISKKNQAKLFLSCRFIKFPPTLIIFGTKLANSLKLYGGEVENEWMNEWMTKTCNARSCRTSECSTYSFRLFAMLVPPKIKQSRWKFDEATTKNNFTCFLRHVYIHLSAANKHWPFTDLSHFGLELVSLKEDEKHCLVHISSLYTATPQYKPNLQVVTGHL